MMSGIRSRNTKPELLTRFALHKLGYRYRLESQIGPIKPDIVLSSKKVAIFVHGCYWHQHKGCRLAYSDRNYSDKWKKKFEDNRLRDERVLNKLLMSGWRVAIVWECATRDPEVFEKVIEELHIWIGMMDSQSFESKFRRD